MLLKPANRDDIFCYSGAFVSSLYFGITYVYLNIYDYTSTKLVL